MKNPPNRRALAALPALPAPKTRADADLYAALDSDDWDRVVAACRYWTAPRRTMDFLDTQLATARARLLARLPDHEMSGPSAQERRTEAERAAADALFYVEQMRDALEWFVLTVGRGITAGDVLPWFDRAEAWLARAGRFSIDFQGIPSEGWPWEWRAGIRRIAGRLEKCRLRLGRLVNLAHEQWDQEPDGRALNTRGESVAVAGGPAEPFLFRYAGRELDLSAAPRRHQLLAALWDGAAGRPHPARLMADVLAELYPDDDEAEEGLKDLQKRIRKQFRLAGLPLTIRTAEGKIWLEPLPG